ncbi:MAG: hypothetical protein CSB48_11625 [Proteobacteria bacterium]|nr:MAG: hypothetical protein CSB48_11625 [Pseudomonadota bacterium]PIE40122.1 MAG: hypothetical protein CSA51_02480 [Gammaproteobacteria bacterium]
MHFISFAIFMAMLLLAGCANQTRQPDAGLSQTLSSSHAVSVEAGERAGEQGRAAKIAAVSPELKGRFDAGIALLDKGDYQAAKPVFIELSQSLPDSLGVLGNLAVCYEKTGEKEEARALYQGILAQDPAWAMAANNLANMYIAEGKFTTAERIFSDAWQSSHQFPQLAYNRAVLNELYLHDARAALRYYQQYIAATGTEDRAIAIRIKLLTRKVKEEK